MTPSVRRFLGSSCGGVSVNGFDLELFLECMNAALGTVLCRGNRFDIFQTHLGHQFLDLTNTRLHLNEQADECTLRGKGE